MSLNDKNNIKKLLEDFTHIAKLAGIDISLDDITIEILQAPHQSPTSLPKGKIGIYIFKEGENYLKVGKVGPKSNARYTSHHYNPKSAKSNLAASLLSDKETVECYTLTQDNIGAWIKENTTRINLLMDETLGSCTLSLLESFLHCRLDPKFEGHQWR